MREETYVRVRRWWSCGVAKANVQVDGAMWWRMSTRSFTIPESEVAGATLEWPAGADATKEVEDR